MTFGSAHRVCVNALAGLGILSLMATGALPLAVDIALGIGILVAVALPDRTRDQRAVRWIATGLPVCVLFVEVVRIATGSDILPAVVELSGVLTIARVTTRKQAQHDYQIALLALLNFISAAVLGGGLAYALCFAALLGLVPVSLVLSHLRREVEGNYRQGARDRSGLPVDVPRILRSRRVISPRFLLLTATLGMPIFAVTALLFIAFPRVGLSLLMLNGSRAERMVGFSDRVDLGGLGALQKDSSLAMRVVPAQLSENPPPLLGLYLRGTAFDSYDGRVWSRSIHEREILRNRGNTFDLQATGRSQPEKTYTIELRPLEPPVLFVPEDTSRVRFNLQQNAAPIRRRVSLLRGTEGGLRVSDPTGQMLRYDVYLSAEGDSPETLSAEDRERYLTVPPSVPERVLSLGESWAEGTEDPYQIARRFEEQLRTSFDYSLDSPSGAAKDPLDHFLFESKTGHCEYYSTAMAILLRGQGIPSRNVAGFAGGRFNPLGGHYAVRQGDAHSWVEAYIDGAGWTRFDPTPPGSITPVGETGGLWGFFRDFADAASQGWEQDVVGYDLKRQTGIVDDAKRAFADMKTTQAFQTVRAHLPETLICLAALGAGVALLLGRRTVRKGRLPRQAAQRVHGAGKQKAAHLYAKLDTAMATAGIPRTPGTTPLAHAQRLRRSRHALGSNIHSSTIQYVKARFGQQPLSQQQQREFTKLIRELAAHKSG